MSTVAGPASRLGRGICWHHGATKAPLFGKQGDAVWGFSRLDGPSPGRATAVVSDGASA